MAGKGSSLSGGRRRNRDLKGQDPAAWVAGESACLVAVVEELGRQAVGLVVDAVEEHLRLRTVGDSVSLA